MDSIYHALVLNLHQPSENLEFLLENSEWEAKEILWALDRMPRALWRYEEIARVHLSLSGILLETIANPDFQSKVYGIIKCGDLLWYLQNTNIFNILGTAYYHPVLPLIPEVDRIEQCKRWLGIGKHLFGREYFSGMWCPEMGFSMELIPMLKKMGYKYVFVDCNHIEPVDHMSWQELRYRPHIARYNNEEIIVIVRDRELSDAQESGMDFGWFQHELHERTKWCNFPPLVTTCTDGDNGGWFRNTSPKGNFWHVFYEEFLEQVEKDWTACKPIFIDEYLDRFGAHGEVKIKTGAWNTGWHNGIDFVQWTGSEKQKEALERVKDTSQCFHDLTKQITTDKQKHHYNEAHWLLLRAETSCNFYWGEDWVYKCHEDLNSVWKHINKILN